MNTSVKHWILLLVAWSIHNLEEALFVKSWLLSHNSNIPLLNKIATDNAIRSFPVALIIVTVLILLFAILAIWKKWDNRFLLILLGIFLINAVQHIVASLYLLSYTPGVITALFLNLPLSIYLIKWHIRNDGQINFGWGKILLCGLLAYVLSMIVIWIIAVSITFVRYNPKILNEILLLFLF